MTIIIKNKQQYRDALETLEDLKLARKKILKGGQSYTLGPKEMHHANLKEISEEIAAYENAIDAYETNGTTKRRSVRAVPLG